MTCAHCTEAIDDDSCFCDQCGEAIKVCPECREPGAKKRCRFHGLELVLASSLRGPTPTSHPDPVPPSSPTPPPRQPVLSLVNHNLNVNISPNHGDVLGRVDGPFSSILGQFGSVSSRHAEIQFIPQQGWVIIDLNSTNKTIYNGTELPPHQPVSIVNGGSLILGQAVEFYTQLQQPGNGPQGIIQNTQNPNTGTIRI